MHGECQRGVQASRSGCKSQFLVKTLEKLKQLAIHEFTCLIHITTEPERSSFHGECQSGVQATRSDCMRQFFVKTLEKLKQLARHEFACLIHITIAVLADVATIPRKLCTARHFVFDSHCRTHKFDESFRTNKRRSKCQSSIIDFLNTKIYADISEYMDTSRASYLVLTHDVIHARTGDCTYRLAARTSQVQKRTIRHAGRCHLNPYGMR